MEATLQFVDVRWDCGQFPFYRLGAREVEFLDDSHRLAVRHLVPACDTGSFDLLTPFVLTLAHRYETRFPLDEQSTV